jgi:hypothetical protein
VLESHGSRNDSSFADEPAVLFMDVEKRGCESNVGKTDCQPNCAAERIAICSHITYLLAPRSRALIDLEE